MFNKSISLLEETLCLFEGRIQCIDVLSVFYSTTVESSVLHVFSVFQGT